MILVIGALLAAAQANVTSDSVGELSVCDEVCLYVNQSGTLDVDSFPKQTIQAYRPYLACHSESLALFTMFVEVGKEKESIAKALKMAFISCRAEREASDKAALAALNGKIPKGYPSPQSAIEHLRMFAVYSNSAVQLLKSGNAKYLVKYRESLVNAAN